MESNRRRSDRAAVTRLRNEVRRIQADDKFGGGFDIPEDISPAEIVLEEMRRAVAFVRWIERQIHTHFPNKLVALGTTNFDIKGAMQTASTEEAAWLELYGRERDRMLRAAKVCHDCGLNERMVQLAEQQAEIMFDLLDRAFQALNLSPAQLSQVPSIMGEVLKAVSETPLTEEA